MYNNKLTVTKRLFKRLKSQCSLDACPRCGKKFVVVDSVLSHRCPKLSNERRYYHHSCWEDMYI
jgi:hypothetical protein